MKIENLDSLSPRELREWVKDLVNLLARYDAEIERLRGKLIREGLIEKTQQGEK